MACVLLIDLESHRMLQINLEGAALSRNAICCVSVFFDLRAVRWTEEGGA
jgi:hypothetical protein